MEQSKTRIWLQRKLFSFPKMDEICRGSTNWTVHWIWNFKSLFQKIQIQKEGPRMCLQKRHDDPVLEWALSNRSEIREAFKQTPYLFPEIQGKEKWMAKKNKSSNNEYEIDVEEWKIVGDDEIEGCGCLRRCCWTKVAIMRVKLVLKNEKLNLHIYSISDLVI